MGIDTEVWKQLKYRSQGHSQPHSPGWARVPLSSFFAQIYIIFSYFSSTFLIFIFNLALRVGKLPIWEGPGFTTDMSPFQNNFQYWANAFKIHTPPVEHLPLSLSQNITFK